MNERGGLSEENLKALHTRLHKADTEGIIAQALHRLVSRRKHLGFFEISGELASVMGLEPAEGRFFKSGFNSRISRLSRLDAQRSLRSMLIPRALLGVPSDEHAIAASREGERNTTDTIDVTVKAALIKQTQSSVDELIQNQASHLSSSDVDYVKREVDRVREYTFPLNQPLPDSDPAKNWLLQSTGSGTLLAIDFYNTNSEPALLVTNTEGHLKVIQQARSLVPENLRRILNSEAES